MALSKIQAESINLADTFAFTGSVSGAGDIQKFSSSTTTQTGLTTLQISLPTTDDFHELLLKFRALICESATNNFWGCTLGDASGNPIQSGYKYIGQYTYSNGSSSGVSYTQSTTGGVYGRLSAHYPGDGSDDTEFTDIEISLKFSNKSDRYTRIFARTGFEKRHTDAYITYNHVAIIRNAAEVNANINIFVTAGVAFTSYGYGLYKVMS